MSLSEDYAQLAGETKKLLIRWEQTKEYWNDENRQKFETNYIIPLNHELKKTQQAMQSINSLLTQARHDCSK